MKLLDIFKKLGILRIGSVSGTYKNYKEMPDELMYDNVYDKKTDLTSKEDYQNIKKTINSTKSGILFYFLLIISVIISLFFGLMINFNSWFFALLIILGFFIFKLIKYKKHLISLKSVSLLFVVYFFVSIIVIFIAIPSKQVKVSLDNNKNTAINTASEIEWIDYIGVKSPIFTFHYPKSYEVQESGTSVLLFVNRQEDYDYHLTFTLLDGLIPISKDCEQLAKGVIATYPGSEFRYAKIINVGASIGCEYGVNIVQNGTKVFEISRNFNTKNQTFYITSYSKKLSDLDILTKIMDSLKLK